MLVETKFSLLGLNALAPDSSVNCYFENDGGIKALASAQDSRFSHGIQ